MYLRDALSVPIIVSCYTLIITSVTLKEQKDEKLLLKLVLSSTLKANDIYFLIPPASNLLEIDRPRGKGVGGGGGEVFTIYGTHLFSNILFILRRYGNKKMGPISPTQYIRI